MKKKGTYVIAKDFKSPYVVSSRDPRNPTQIRWKHFKRGEIIAAEMHLDGKGQPKLLMYNGVCVVPLSVAKAVVTKEIISSASGAANTDMPGTETTKKIVTVKNPKTRYIDAGIFGALLGMGVVLLANKQNWIVNQDKKHYLYGAGVGAAAAMYFIYRKNNNQKVKTL